MIVRNFMANTPLFIALAFKFVSDMLFNLSFKLHITFGTEAGKKLEELDKAAKQMLQAIKESRGQVPIQNGDRKLVDILNGGTSGRSSLGTPRKD
jgi:hypothetical protein